MKIPEHNKVPPELQQQADDFLLGNMGDAQAADFETQMQDNFELAMYVSGRVAFLDLVEKSAHVSGQPVQLELSQQVNAKKNNAHLKTASWMVGVAAAVCIAINLTSVPRDSRSSTASNTANPREATSTNSSQEHSVETDELGQVADLWLVMLQQERSDNTEYLNDLDLLPISTDENWIGELAVQAYQDSEA
ncbi:MAG: hypothetical protein Aurels2KO_16820 [Aureliella sp.]